MSVPLAKLKSKRAVAKASITRIHTFLESVDNPLIEELECRLSLLEAYFKQILSIQDQIEDAADALESDKSENYIQDIESSYCTLKARLMSTISERKRSESSGNGCMNNSDNQADKTVIVQNQSYSYLPKVKLPHFSGSYLEYTNFINAFEVAVNQHESLSSLEKFLHLRSCVSGEALQTITPLEVTADNYKEALQLLENRYGNKYIIFQSHIGKLMEIPASTKETASQIRAVIDTINGHVTALRALGSDAEILNSIIVYLVRQKLDTSTTSKWEESLDFQSMPTWDTFATFLNNRCQYLSTREVKAQPTYTKNIRKPAQGRSSAFVISKDHCIKCESAGHTIYACPTFKKLSVAERFSETKRLALCINCLSKGHSVKNCRSSACRVCGSHHHTLLHRYDQSLPKPQPAQTAGETHHAENMPNQNIYNQSVLHSTIDVSTNDKVMLATAVVQVKHSSGLLIPVRALLDSASQLNFISEALVQKLQLKRNRVNTEILGIGQLPSKVKFATNLTVHSRINKFSVNTNALVLTSITGVQPESPIDIQNWNVPANLQLADPRFNIPQKIDLLLGAEMFYELLSVGQIKIGETLPILQKTVLGWVVAGRYRSPDYSREASILITEQGNQAQWSENLSQQMENFWKIEDVTRTSNEWTQEQLDCEHHFRTTTTREVDGRFQVRLPFKMNPNELGQSYSAAMRSLLRLETKFIKYPDLKAQYVDFLTEYEEQNHMKLSKMRKEEIKYFIPHRAVLRPDSSTTKLRVVFNASAPTSSNISLNDTLMVGPTVQNNLYTILVKFRMNKYAVTADVCQMYRQINVHPDDQPYLGILWRKDPQSEVQTYVLTTVTYGTACAPFQATRCLNSIAEEHVDTLASGARAIKENFYVDDLISGAQTVEDLINLKDEVETRLMSGQFKLRKWASNSPEFLSLIPDEDREATRKINDSEVIKALGLMWNPITDDFQFVWNCPDPVKNPTKRSVLAKISTFFDPLGLLTPLLIIPKIIMQKLWSLKIDWDESLPAQIHTEWEKFEKQLQNVNIIRIPRFVFPEVHNTFELHGFADASAKAYGCCIYVRAMNHSGEVSVRLVTSKSRVSPLKTQSLPRLELCAALLLAQLFDSIKSTMQNMEKTVLWTDSEIVLHWIRGESSAWNTFVANRASQIQQLTQSDWWHHVPTKSNPADIVSRGLLLKDLERSIWFTGPKFLYQSTQHWPSERDPDSSLDVPERRKPKAILLVQGNYEDIVADNKFVTNYQKLRRIFAYVMKFIHLICWKLKTKNVHIKLRVQISEHPKSTISTEDLEEAERRLAFAIQEKAYKNERTLIARGKEIDVGSRLKPLCPFLDEGCPQLLRVGGRLREANLPYSAKFSIILPKHHPFSQSYLMYLHKKLFHAGAQTSMSASRQKFWIISVRDLAKQVVHRCLHCFHYRPKTLHQIMGNLPKERIEYSQPFVNTGVDFFGPLLVSSRIRGRPPTKAYGSLFICFASKAVHIELVSELSAEAFISALKRFISRRGICINLFCDNATNFVGANSKLEKLKDMLFTSEAKRSLIHFGNENQIKFHFIPPRSPHFGGLWESTIKIAKYHLLRAVHNSSLSFEEMTTFLSQVEAILNSRPISAMSADPNDEAALTPGHFLIGRPLLAIPEPDLTELKPSLLSRWQHVCVLQQHFWRRWKHEYVPLLQQRYKWNSLSPDVKCGTLVLLADDQQPPQHWLTGRIIHTYPGKDGHIRVVDVKTRQGEFRRSITKVAPLPLLED